MNGPSFIFAPVSVYSGRAGVSGPMRPCFAEYRSTSTISPKNGENASVAPNPHHQKPPTKKRIASAAASDIPMIEKMRPART